MSTSSFKIPFFNDLPAAAIRPATRLWDAARAASYNGATAYSDFVQQLNDASVAPPPRAVFKQWIAGVQAGLINRPGDAVEHANPLSYFDSLPDGALPASQAMWDKIDSKAFVNAALFAIFCREMRQLGHRPPVRAEFDTWVRAIGSGEAERPVRQIADVEGSTSDETAATMPQPQLSPVEATAEPKQAESAAGNDTPQPEAPSSRIWGTVGLSMSRHFAEVMERPPLAALMTGSSSTLKDLVEQAIDAKAAALQADARTYARMLIAEELRELAGELESVS